jgi:fibronectin-binding autotransporter adhesin
MIADKILRISTMIFVLGLSLTLLASPAAAATCTWGNNGVPPSSTSLWSPTSDWVGGAVPGTNDVAVFNSVMPYTFQPYVDTGSTIGAIQFTAFTPFVNSASIGISGSTALTLSGNALSNGATIDVQRGAGGLTISDAAGITTSGPQTWQNNNSVINANALTVSAPVSLGGTLTLGGSGGMVLSGAISGANGLNLQTTGPVTLSGANTYTGNTVLSSGTLVINNAKALGANNTLTIGGGAIDCTSATTLANSNSFNWNSDFTFIGTANLSMGTGAVAMNASRTVTVNGGTLTVGGPISGANFGLTKTGPGTLTLQGLNTYGGTTAVNAGQLTLDYSTNTSNVLNSGNAVTLGGGTLFVNAKSGSTSTSSQTLGAVTATAGASSITVNSNSGAMTFTMGALTDATVGSSLDINPLSSGTKTITTTTGPDATGIYGGRTTFNGSNWVTSASTAAPYALSAYSAYTTLTTALSDTTKNALLTSGSLLRTASGGVNTLKLNATGGTLVLDNDAVNNYTLTVAGAGLLVTGNSTASINNGYLQGGSGSDLLVIQNDSANFTIGASVQNNGGATGLTKSGSGMLTLAGSNSYTGGTMINTGTVAFAAGGLGSTGTVTMNGGVLNWSGTNAQDISSRLAMVNGGNAILDTGTNSVSFASAIGSGASSALTKRGAGLLTLNAPSTYTGPTNLSAGTLALAGGNNILPAGSTLNFTANSTALNVGATSQTLANLTVANGVTGIVAGSGALTLTGPLFQIGSNVSGSSQIVNLSGLSTFNYSNAAGALLIGGSSNTGSGASSATLTLAATNTITATSLNIANITQTVVTGNNTGIVNLGVNNTIEADYIVLGGGRGNGTLQYSPVTNPITTIRGSAGGTSRTANVYISASAAPAVAHVSSVNLTGNVTGTSTLDARIGTLTIGQNARTSNAGGNFMQVNGSLGMGGGTLDATNIVIGQNLTTSFSNAGASSSTVGAFTLAGGNVIVGSLYLADQNDSLATAPITANFNLNGGSIFATLIASGTGTGTGNGAAVTRNFNWNNGTIANYNANGGTTGLTVSLPTLTLAATGTHTFSIDAGQLGTVTSVIAGSGALTKIGPGSLALDGANTYFGGTTLSAGSLQLGAFNSSALGTGGLGVNGGTLDLNANGITVAALSGSGGLITDSSVAMGTTTLTSAQNGNSVFSGKIADGGNGTLLALTMNGTGSLALGGANTFSGPMNVNSGKVYINGSVATTSISVADGATLGGSGSASSGTATVGSFSGGIVEAGYSGSGSLTLGGLAFNTTDTVNLSNPNNYKSVPAINVTGSNGLFTNGTVTVNVLGTPPSGTGLDHVLKYSGAIGGTGYNFVLGTPVPSGRNLYSLVNDAGYVDFQYSVDYPYWTGAGNLSWDTTSSNNWNLNSNNTATTYQTGDNVIFDNRAIAYSGSGTKVVNINAGNVAPNSVTFSNSAVAYTLQGSYGITGSATALTVNGGGVVTIATTANSYGGGTQLQSGTIILGANGGLPLGDTVSFGSASGSGTLDLAGFNQSVGSLAVGAGAAAAGQVITASTGSSTLTYIGSSYSAFAGTVRDTAGTTGGTLGLYVSSGTLDLSSGIAVYAGATTANGGVLLANSLPNTSGITVSPSGGLSLSGSNLNMPLGISNSGSVAFTATSGTVTLGALSGNGTMSFNSPAATIATFGSQIVGLNGTALTVSAGTQNFDGAILGTGSLIKTGTGLTVLSGTGSTFAGGVAVNGGTLFAEATASGSALGSGMIGLNGGQLSISNDDPFNSAVTISHAVFIGTSGGSLAVLGASPGGVSITGGISGSNPLVLTGTGLLTVSAYNNGFSGGFIVNGGTLAFGNSNNIAGQSYLGIGPLVVNSGAVAFADNVNSLGYVNNGGTPSIYGAVVPSVTLTGGTLVAGDNHSTSKGRLPNTTMTGAAIVPLGVGSNSEFDPADTSGTMTVTVNPSTTTSTISVAILGLLSNINFNVSRGTTASGVDLTVASSLNYYNQVSSVTKSGPGLMVLTGPDTGGGPTSTSSFEGSLVVNGGTLVAAAASSTLGSTSVLGSADSTRTIAVNAGGTLVFEAPNVFGQFNAITAPTLAINSGLVTNADPLAGTSGSGTINNALNNITLTNGVLTATTGQNGGYAAWNINGTITSSGNSLISTSDPVFGTVMLNSASGSSGTTTINVASGTLTISAPLVQDNLDGIVDALTTTGSGTLVLSGSDNYTGGTTVESGTLVLASPNALAAGSSLTVGQGASSLFAPSIAGPAIEADHGYTVPAGVTAVPEPGTLLLLLAALGCAAICRYNGRRK